MKQATKLPDNVIAAIFVHIYCGWGVLYLTKLIGGHLTHNSYWGLLVAMLITLPFVASVAGLAKLFPGAGINEIFGRVFGKAVGTVLGLVYLVHFLYFIAIHLRDGQIMVYTYFFQRTPFILLIAFIMAGALYVALHGLESVGRLAAFMLFPPFAVIFLLQLIGLPNIDPVNLQPVFEGSWRDWLLSGTDLLVILLPATGISAFLSFLPKPESIKKITVYCWAMVIPLFLINILGTVGTFGPGVIHRLNWASVEYFHLIDYPFLLLEQTGLFFLIAWYPFTFVILAQGLFIGGNQLHSMFPGVKRHWFICALALGILIVVNLPISLIGSERFFLRYQKVAVAIFLTLHLGTWLVARLRKRP